MRGWESTAACRWGPHWRARHLPRCAEKIAALGWASWSYRRCQERRGWWVKMFLPPANGRGASALCCLRGGISAPLRDSAERSAPPLTTSQASAAGPPDRGVDEETSRGKPARKKSSGRGVRAGGVDVMEQRTIRKVSARLIP